MVWVPEMRTASKNAVHWFRRGLPALHAAYLLECPSRQNGKASIEKEKNPISDGGRAFGRAAADATENLLTTPTTVPEGRRAD